MRLLLPAIIAILFASQALALEPTPAEREILNQGLISDGNHLAGGALGTLFGFGIGQAVQGRYLDTGWIFTVGEVGSLGLMVAGASDSTIGCATSYSYYSTCTSRVDSKLALGLVAFVVVRIWELIDVWIGPVTHNDKYRRLKKRYGEEANGTGASLTILPSLAGGATLGLQFRF